MACIRNSKIWPRLSNTCFPLLRMLILSAGLLHGSCSSVVRSRAPTAIVRGLGFDPQWLPRHFVLSVRIRFHAD